MPDINTDPQGWLLAQQGEQAAPPPSRPWASIPARSTAPAAVQAIRARRVLREAARNRWLAWDEEARYFLRSGKPDDPLRQWAAKWLGQETPQ